MADEAANARIRRINIAGGISALVIKIVLFSLAYHGKIILTRTSPDHLERTEDRIQFLGKYLAIQATCLLIAVINVGRFRGKIQPLEGKLWTELRNWIN